MSIRGNSPLTEGHLLRGGGETRGAKRRQPFARVALLGRPLRGQGTGADGNSGWRPRAMGGGPAPEARTPRVRCWSVKAGVSDGALGGRDSAKGVRLFVGVLGCILAVALCAGVCAAPGPMTFLYGAQDTKTIPLAKELGLNTLYLDLEREDLDSVLGGAGAETDGWRDLDARLDLARANGLQVIVAIPTVPRTLSLVPSVTGEKYRAWVAALIARVVGHFRSRPEVVAWATGDFLERNLDPNAADFQAFLRERYGTPEAVATSWGVPLQTWADADPLKAREIDRDKPFGVGRASVDVADFAQWAFRSVMHNWAALILSSDPTRPLLTGRISTYRDLTAVPAVYSLICPFIPPDKVEPDPIAHNLHAVDIARRGGRFGVIPCLELPQNAGAVEDGSLVRWMGLAALHGAQGIGLADWERLEKSPAPDPLFAAIQGQLARARPEWFTLRPRPSLAVLYEPYAEGCSRNGQGAYGYLAGFSPGEPNNPLWAFRVGCRYGLLDVLTSDDVPVTDLRRYSAVLAPLCLELEANVRNQLSEYVRGGGALVADIGLGVYETGSWMRLPPELGPLAGVQELGEMHDVLQDLRVAQPPSWLPSLPFGARTQGALNKGAKEGTPADFRDWHVSGPACSAVLTPEGRALAVLDTRFVDRKRAITGLVGRADGAGIACFATHRLWADWKSSDPVYIALHNDLAARQPAVELLGEAFWPRGVCVTATDDGVAVLNATAVGLGVDVVDYGAQHALLTDAFCAYSALARNPDGTRSGICRVSVALPAGALVHCRRMPVLVQPFTGNCLARLIRYMPHEVVLDVGGTGAAVVKTETGRLRVGSGEATEVRITLGPGAYPTAPGTAHRVRVEPEGGKATEAVVCAGDSGLRFSVTVTRARISVRPEGKG